VAPGDKVVRIARLKRIRAEGFVKADDVVRDLTGLPVTVTATIAGRGSATFAGKVELIHNDIDPVNGQMRIWAEVANPNRRLLPGMKVDMKILPPPPNRRRTSP
jgi:macrolide-specific efflux system membrane fusion protein